MSNLSTPQPAGARWERSGRGVCSGPAGGLCSGPAGPRGRSILSIGIFEAYKFALEILIDQIIRTGGNRYPTRFIDVFTSCGPGVLYELIQDPGKGIFYRCGPGACVLFVDQ